MEGEESKRKKNRNEEPPALYSRDDSPAGLHSRAEEMARWSFPAPARARASHPPPPRNRPQCAARSRAREKRTLAAFLPSRAAASVLAAAGRARRRAKAANTRACSPWAQGPVGPTSQTRPRILIFISGISAALIKNVGQMGPASRRKPTKSLRKSGQFRICWDRAPSGPIRQSEYNAFFLLRVTWSHRASFTYDSWPIPRPGKRSTSRDFPGHRIGVWTVWIAQIAGLLQISP